MADVNAGIAAPASRDSKRRSALLKLGALAGILAAAAVLATFTPVGALLSREGVLSAVGWLRQSPWAPVVFVAAYAGATALALPGSVLTLAGGAVFGLWWGTLYNTLGANLGANLAFWIARSLGRDGVRALAGNRLDALDRATASYGFQGLLTLRLIPVVPFNALNFGAGLTGISWPAYAAATLIGILPGTFVYTMFADALLAGSTEASRQAFIRVLISGGLLVALSFLPTLARKLGIRLPGGSGGPGDAPRPGSSGG
ncbi:MAG: TVP38/TMEM64 family protein, partial [Gemmatimonadota bacterium]